MRTDKFGPAEQSGDQGRTQDKLILMFNDEFVLDIIILLAQVFPAPPGQDGWLPGSCQPPGLDASPLSAAFSCSQPVPEATPHERLTLSLSAPKDISARENKALNIILMEIIFHLFRDQVRGIFLCTPESDSALTLVPYSYPPGPAHPTHRTPRPWCGLPTATTAPALMGRGAQRGRARVL